MPLTLTDVIDETEPYKESESENVSEHESEAENVQTEVPEIQTRQSRTDDAVNEESPSTVTLPLVDEESSRSSSSALENIPDNNSKIQKDDRCVKRSVLDDILDEKDLDDEEVKPKVSDQKKESSESLITGNKTSTKKKNSKRASWYSSESEDDSSSEDETSDEEAAREAKQKKVKAKQLAAQAQRKEKHRTTTIDVKTKDESPYAEYPDPAYLDQLSDEKISKQDLSKLRWWSYLIVLDKNDRSTWKLPYRDGLGRLNRPLLAHARHVLTDERRVNEMELLLSRQVLDQAKKCFHRAWPGQPVKLVKAVDAPVSSAIEPLQSVQSLIQESQALKKKLDGGEHAKTEDAKAKTKVVEVESDAAPNLLMKIRERKRQQQQQMLSANSSTSKTGFNTNYSRPLANASTLNPLKLDLLAAARKALAEKRQHEHRVGRQVAADIERNNPHLANSKAEADEQEERPPNSEAAEKDAQDSDEADEDWKPDEEGDDDSNDEGSSEEENEVEDEEEEAESSQVKVQIPLADEEEFGEASKSRPNQGANPTVENEQTRDVADTEAVPNDAGIDDAPLVSSETLALLDGDAAQPPSEVHPAAGDDESASEAPKSDKYRALLEAEAAKVARQPRSRFFENEAEEENEEDQVGNYGLNVKEKVIGMDSDASDDEDERNLLPTEEDLKNIVDTNSDDEGQDDNVRDLHFKQKAEEDEKLVNRLKRDLKNGTLVERRRKLNASGIQRVLDDGDSDSDSDEERQQATQKRLEDEMKARLADARNAPKRGRFQLHLGDTEEEVKADFEQAQKFEEMSRRIRLTSSSIGGVRSMATGRAPSKALQGLSASLDLDEEVDEDTRTLRECLARSNSQPAFEYSSSSQQGLESLFPGSLPMMNRSESLLSSSNSISAAQSLLRRSTTLIGASRSTVATMTNTFVYTKKAATFSSSSNSSQSSTTSGSDQMTSSQPLQPQPQQPHQQIKRARTLPLSNSKKRRVDLQPVPISQLASRALLAPPPLQSTVFSGRRD